jgi:hypothetical protein
MTFRLLGGPDDGEQASLEISPDSPLADIEPGMTIVVARNPDAPRFLRYSFVDVQRGTVLVALALVFAIAVVALGRIRGVAALLGLAATFLLILEFVLPRSSPGTIPPSSPPSRLRRWRTSLCTWRTGSDL